MSFGGHGRLTVSTRVCTYVVAGSHFCISLSRARKVPTIRSATPVRRTLVDSSSWYS